MKILLVSSALLLITTANAAARDCRAFDMVVGAKTGVQIVQRTSNMERSYIIHNKGPGLIRAEVQPGLGDGGAKDTFVVLPQMVRLLPDNKSELVLRSGGESPTPVEPKDNQDFAQVNLTICQP
jgi:P pilus assembly chaperone PapD